MAERVTKETHRDRVFRYTRVSNFRLVRKDMDGRENDLLDTNNKRVGEVRFDSKGHFIGGRIYDRMVVKGRTKNTHQALVEFEKELEEWRVRT